VVSAATPQYQAGSHHPRHRHNPELTGAEPMPPVAAEAAPTMIETREYA
jgi:hypothetical protein